MSDAHSHNPLVVAVLLDPPVLQCITSFMRGPAYALKHFYDSECTVASTASISDRNRNKVVQTCCHAQRKGGTQKLLRMLEEYCGQRRKRWGDPYRTWGTQAFKCALDEGELQPLMWLAGVMRRRGYLLHTMLNCLLTRLSAKVFDGDGLWRYNRSQAYRETADCCSQIILSGVPHCQKMLS